MEKTYSFVAKKFNTQKLFQKKAYKIVAQETFYYKNEVFSIFILNKMLIIMLKLKRQHRGGVVLF